MHVFAYGSLLNPASLRSTLPAVDLGVCLPARARGFVRCFDVGFPNDGSQSDKRYFDARGRPPAQVLMCNIRPDEAYAVNGICIPVDEDALARLEDRERRYDLVDITGQVEPYPRGGEPARGSVVGFIGKERFTGAGGRDAFASRAYLETIADGAKYWDEFAPEFYHLTMATTLFPDPSRIVDLRRVDL